MIRAAFFTKDGLITGFHINGHSGYSHVGNDIVCAAVSSAAFMAANTITDVIGAKAEVSTSDSLMILKLNEEDAVKSRVVLEGLRLHLLQLQEQYKKYIKVIFSEV